MRVLVATRSGHKLREIQQILGGLESLELIDLTQAGIAPEPAEEEIEKYQTFEENALAKARYFARLSGLPTLADDSGLCVGALGGEPGVRSKRFSGRPDLAGGELDAANNERLLKALEGVDEARRDAHYVCVVALVDATDEQVARGQCDGVILRAPRGGAGFGYDPLFFIPEREATFGELPAEVKNGISHRARALRALLPELSRAAADSISDAPSATSAAG